MRELAATSRQADFQAPHRAVRTPPTPASEQDPSPSIPPALQTLCLNHWHGQLGSPRARNITVFKINCCMLLCFMRAPKLLCMKTKITISRLMQQQQKSALKGSALSLFYCKSFMHEIHLWVQGYYKTFTAFIIIIIIFNQSSEMLVQFQHFCVTLLFQFQRWVLWASKGKKMMPIHNAYMNSLFSWCYLESPMHIKIVFSNTTSNKVRVINTWVQIFFTDEWTSNLIAKGKSCLFIDFISNMNVLFKFV